MSQHFRLCLMMGNRSPSINRLRKIEITTFLRTPLWTVRRTAFGRRVTQGYSWLMDKFHTSTSKIHLEFNPFPLRFFCCWEHEYESPKVPAVNALKNIIQKGVLSTLAPSLHEGLFLPLSLSLSLSLQSHCFSLERQETDRSELMLLLLGSLRCVSHIVDGLIESTHKIQKVL